MVFYHPKKYKELHGLTSRKCNTRQRAPGSLPANGALKSDQVISSDTATAASERAPGPGPKPQATSYKLPGPRPISNANKGLIHKRKAASVKHQAVQDS